ncbi:MULTISPECIES: hypothetical protein [Pseudomonas]|uniref:Uncharacterized protein n=1 Tax=Pseudomonas asplenii TaxID=53407 RepID=A0A0M9GCZ4_9PSED|nr:hypothetical protein [Pseudomonas fuscovaginae]KPA87888.1 hypothetical protein PF66_05465 [Pseudomonas fuscovaginae]KPA99016.1 hypothetical protein PF70_00853 [Pseudomonas fuscovaginae]
MKNLVKSAMAAALILAVPAISHAGNPILESLKSQGLQPAELSDKQLGDIKGAALITGQPMPSVTQGLQTYHVTWKKFGSQSDYRSYNIVGTSYDPHGVYTYDYDGGTYYVAGDRWLADKTSNVGAWNLAYATEIDLHVQVLHPETKQPSVYGFRTSSWNRPISTFSW